MSLSATDYYSLYRPSICERRVFLRAHKEPESKPSEYEKLLEELGRRHENNHLLYLGKFEDLSQGNLDERTEKTIAAVLAGAEVIYQAQRRSRLQVRESLTFYELTGILRHRSAGCEGTCPECPSLAPLTWCRADD